MPTIHGTVLILTGFCLGAAGVLAFQKYTTPSTFDECLLAETKSWSEAEMAVVSRVCSTRFPWNKDRVLIQEKSSQTD